MAFGSSLGFVMLLLCTVGYGSSLSYLDEDDPFYVGTDFPKLATPQWIGDPTTEAVVILAIDDMRSYPKYETFLRPILDRLKRLDGRAHVSIMCNALDVREPHLQQWIDEGVSMEVHTLSHPCPLLAKGDFHAAEKTYFGGIDLIRQIPRNHPVAFRMPCCDSINSPSPRFYAELFNRPSAAGGFLSIDSSVMCVLNGADRSIRRDRVFEADGRPRFEKYLPFPSFTTTIENYPYPYVIGKRCWEFPAMVPSDWEAQHIHGVNQPKTIDDWKAALDITVAKQGVFTMIFHPHGWIRNDQIIELIDYAAARYGQRVAFRNFPEVLEAINRHLLAGQPLRDRQGHDHGVRLLDVNRDGYLDVVMGNDRVRKTRIWRPADRAWSETRFPVRLVQGTPRGSPVEIGVRFGVVGEPQRTVALVRNGQEQGAWRFEGGGWKPARRFIADLRAKGRPIFTRRAGRDQGVRFRDVDRDGQDELLVANEEQQIVLRWANASATWTDTGYAWPPAARFVDNQGRDNGLRFVDVNRDGFEDLLQSNASGYLLSLFVPEAVLGFAAGWSRQVLVGTRDDPDAIPPIVSEGKFRNQGAWFAGNHLWVQNEDTAALPDLVDRRSFDTLLKGRLPAPKSPEDSLRCIQVPEGFQVQLVAREPLVQDPVGFEWGADGRLWVVEMGDYPLGIDEQGKPGGVVRFLKDQDGDGVYDQSTIFLADLNFPNGVMPWRDGVLISAAPDILFARDIDGDGHADVVRAMLTGFREGNQQHRINGFEYGLDNWVYLANGDSGGVVRSLFTGAEVDLRGHDLRFQPDTGLMEAIEGQTQFGRHRDDWGNWFGNNNPNWLWHFYFPEAYLKRNGSLAVTRNKTYLGRDDRRVFSVSAPLQRFNDVGAKGYVTSANSPTPYRDTVFGPPFGKAVFVSEPVHNVVHCQILTPEGIHFRSRRFPEEGKREFLASTDNWFRPTMLKTGPDGALYIADMYRLVIEHPQWIPDDVKQKLDLRAGHDRGRLYRVFPAHAKLAAVKRLSGLETAGLVDALDSENGWQRDTAQRLLVHRRDRSAVPRLARLLRANPNPKVRVQVLGTLDGLKALDDTILLEALNDSHWAVQAHAIRLCEPILRNETTREPRGRAAIIHRLFEMGTSVDIRVRYQLAFSLGELDDPEVGRLLVKLASRDPDETAIQNAVLSSSSGKRGAMIRALFEASRVRPDNPSLLRRLVKHAAREHDRAALGMFFADLTHSWKGRLASWQLQTVSAYLSQQDQDWRASARTAWRQVIQGILSAAEVAAHKDDRPAPLRVEAIRCLAEAGGKLPLEGFVALIEPHEALSVQKAVIRALNALPRKTSLDSLWKRWTELSPGIQNELVEQLVTKRTLWTRELLARLKDASKVQPTRANAGFRQGILARIKNDRDPERRRLYQEWRASIGKPSAVSGPPRLDVGELVENVLRNPGDSAKGHRLFQANCMACHRYRGEGQDVGPQFETVVTRGIATLLEAIVFPNRAVERKYLAYQVADKKGNEWTGIIADENANSLRLRMPNAEDVVLLRSDIKDFRSLGTSLMPEGFGEAFSDQDLANVVAYLRSSGSR